MQETTTKWHCFTRTLTATGQIRLIALTLVGLLVTDASAQVRMKAPDRGTYQSPTLAEVESRNTGSTNSPAGNPTQEPAANSQSSGTQSSGTQSTGTQSTGTQLTGTQQAGMAELLRGRRIEIGNLVRASGTSAPSQQQAAGENTSKVQYADQAKRLPLMNVVVESRTQNARRSNPHQSVRTSGQPGGQLRPVNHEEEVVLLPPQVSRPHVARQPAQPQVITLEPPVRMRQHHSASHALRQETESEPQADTMSPELMEPQPMSSAPMQPQPMSPAPVQSEVMEPAPMHTEVYHDLHSRVHGCDSPGCDSIGCNAMGCDSMGCDTFGCDSMGCDSIGCYRPWYRMGNASLSFDRDRWFGSAELLLLWRRGDRLPPLVTTGPDTDPDTAGTLDDPDTVILFPTDALFRDMTVGGRFTLGTWLDSRQCRSLVLRGWFAGEETARFSVNQDDVPVIARPFLDVEVVPNEQSAVLIGFPGRTENGSVSIRTSSNVYGADLAVRQYWYGKYGATVDVLYGYQYMMLNEDLRISSSSFDPVLQATQMIDDSFDVENEFHGGQFGIATRYRECCWSFNALFKVAFGSLARRASLSGSTINSVGTPPVVSEDPQGLLVRSTNSGTSTDHTFGWIPEIDLSIGWQRWPCWEATFGYNIIAMTDAVRVSGVIDPDLGVNLSDPLVGEARPRLNRKDNTFYLQGIHFGLQYVY
ncbi:MAG: BBP7 family outer membrane beta-barrel protein [Planctomycetota bacterium]